MENSLNFGERIMGVISSLCFIIGLTGLIISLNQTSSVKVGTIFLASLFIVGSIGLCTVLITNNIKILKNEVTKKR